MAAKKNKQTAEYIAKAADGRTIKAGKVSIADSGKSTYEKAMDAMSYGTPKEGGVKKKAKAVTKSNAKGTLGSKNSKKRN